jgi:hypothetical protein
MGPLCHQQQPTRPERSTTSTALPETSTIKALRALGNRLVGILAAAYATTPSTANTPPGHAVKPPKPLDKLRPWDVYTAQAVNHLDDEAT